MAVDLVKEIEKMAPRRDSLEREGYYVELQKKCDRLSAVYEAILNTIFQCQVLINVSKERRRNLHGKKYAAREEYERFKKDKKEFIKLLDRVVDEIDGTLTFRPEPKEWPRDHMGIGKGSAETSINQSGRMVGIRAGSFKSGRAKGGRPKNVYQNIVLLMLDSKLREYRIKPRYMITADILYYFFDGVRERESSYDADTVKRIIMRLRHKNKTLVSHVEATLLKARALSKKKYCRSTAKPWEDSIEF